MARRLLACLALCALAACSDAPRSPIRYVVLISLDTVRADALGCYDASATKSPSIDRLANLGVRFEHAITAAPTTLASHASIMTGRYPHAHGVPRNGFVLHPDNITLAEIFAQRGYATAAFLGSFALDKPFGLDQGFQLYDARFTTELGTAGVDQSQRSASEVTDSALRWFDETRPERAFVFLHYFDAHAPYAPKDSGLPPVTLDTLSRRALAHQQRWISSPPGWEAPLLSGLPRELIGRVDGTPLDAFDAQIEAQYAAEIAEIDTQLERVFRVFGTPERAADTLIVVTADHGESFHEHADFFNHGLWLHETTVHVPLILRAPGLAPRSVAQPVSSVDLAPTVLELAGIDSMVAFDGVSLVPLARGEARPRGPVFSEATQPTHPSFERGAWANALKPSCIVDGRWKLIRAPYLGLEQLFDLESDPHERVDLLARGDAGAPPNLSELRARLDAWEHTARPLPSNFSREQADEVARRLRELGYTEGLPPKER
ncbi:MAG: sulfatase [Planctomycetes bacterium]|nr:sulfatase [Planctomycetota bacterium]